MAQERKASRTQQQGSTGTALVAVGDIKKSMIKDALHNMGMRFRSSKERQRDFDDRARGAGNAAGDRAGLHRPVNGGAGVLRLK